MHKNVLPLVLTTALLAPAAAIAADSESGFYVGGVYTNARYDESGLTEDFDLGVLSLRGGYQINEGLAFEVRVGTGVTDDSAKYADGLIKVEVEAEEVYGAYLKAGMPTSVGLYPYILVGWTEVKVQATATTLGAKASASDRGGDYGLGVGLDYRFNSNLSVGLEYAQLYEKDDYEIVGVSLGVNYKF